MVHRILVGRLGIHMGMCDELRLLKPGAWGSGWHRGREPSRRQKIAKVSKISRGSQQNAGWLKSRDGMKIGNRGELKWRQVQQGRRSLRSSPNNGMILA